MRSARGARIVAGMQLLDALREEHALIEKVVLSLGTFAGKLARGETTAADGEAYARFFRLYVGRFHHGREEDVLFPALARETEAPVDRGPIHVMLEDHHAMAALQAELADSLRAAPPDAAGAARLLDLTGRFQRALLRHIDAENGVLFPESEARFRRACVQDLPDREPDEEEAAACAGATSLLLRHAPARIEGFVRGEGCPGCEAFGTRCDGVEREWSSDLEWEDMVDRVG